MFTIDRFAEEYAWLSNFYECTVTYEGLEFTSVEAAYQAAKTTSIETRKLIQCLPYAGDCKRFGRSVKLRSDWEDIKLTVMEDLLRQKFKRGSYLASQLLITRRHQLIEGNKWNDTFWGVCRGVGENNLGKLLMKIRDELVTDLI